MSAQSDIEWCDHTFNPWWGCTKVSPACKHCYAASFSRRLGRDLWGDQADRLPQGDAYWQQPREWDRRAVAVGERHRVFCASMADVFEAREDLVPQRRRLWALIEETRNLDWLLLTKRPENIRHAIPDAWHAQWPRNVWLGVTAESQECADFRIPILLEHDVIVHFVSAEPLLESLDLRRYLSGSRPVDWVIAGGESGPGARPTEEGWLRELRDQCVDSSAAFFFKQWGNWAPNHASGTLARFRSKKQAGRLLDGRTWDEFPRGRGRRR